MRVLGIDISSVATGWAVAESSESTENGINLYNGCIVPIDELKIIKGFRSKKETKEQTTDFGILCHIASRCGDIMRQYNPNIVVIEDCYFDKNVRTLQLLSRLSGAVIWEWWHTRRYNIDPLVISAASARKFLGCKGTATKDEIKKFLCDRFHYSIDDDNMADASVLALYGYKKLLGDKHAI